jgi:hypothetical protein
MHLPCTIECSLLQGVVSASAIQNSAGGHRAGFTASEPPSLNIAIVAEASGTPVLPQTTPPTHDEDDSNMQTEGINSDVSGIVWPDGGE